MKAPGISSPIADTPKRPVLGLLQEPLGGSQKGLAQLLLPFIPTFFTLRFSITRGSPIRLLIRVVFGPGSGGSWLRLSPAPRRHWDVS